MVHGGMGDDFAGGGVAEVPVAQAAVGAPRDDVGVVLALAVPPNANTVNVLVAELGTIKK